MSFSELGLLPELVAAVEAKGYTTPSPIQARAIPAVLERRDVLGGAQTGTGKTAAFSLPMLQILAGSEFNGQNKRPRALVLAPTRELAAQVHQSIVDYGQHVKIRSCVIFGGVGFQPQINALRRGLDIVVATPGRLLDLCQRGEMQLSNIEMLVLDEADRMLDMGFINDIKKILQLMPAKRQNLFFSATYTKEVKKLADSMLHNAVEVEVAARNATADRVDQEAYVVAQKAKPQFLGRTDRAGGIGRKSWSFLAPSMALISSLRIWISKVSAQWRFMATRASPPVSVPSQPSKRTRFVCWSQLILPHVVSTSPICRMW